MYKSFKDMPVWQHAMEIAEHVFSATEHLPKKEDYGLTSQIRRSALSISANMAEGFGRSHTLDKVNFYYNARGSLTETLSHLEYARRTGYVSSEVTSQKRIWSPCTTKSTRSSRRSRLLRFLLNLNLNLNLFF